MSKTWIPPRNQVIYHCIICGEEIKEGEFLTPINGFVDDFVHTRHTVDLAEMVLVDYVRKGFKYIEIPIKEHENGSNTENTQGGTV